MSSTTESFVAALRADGTSHRPCAHCGFELWAPLWSLSVSDAGLYDDARFPGRLIVSLGDHHDHLDELPVELLTRFMADVATASRTLRFHLGVDRVNVAVLGNQESHVHAHLIPRRPSVEPAPYNAPWQDPRPRRKLTNTKRAELVALLRSPDCW